MFETFEHKADIGIRGKGKSLEEAFCECAKALFSVIVDLDSVNEESVNEFELEAENREELLVGFLSELLYLHDAEEMIYNRFDLYIIKEGEKLVLKGKAFGEKIDLKKHGIKREVKAATYHQLKVEESSWNWIAQCVVDV